MAHRPRIMLILAALLLVPCMASAVPESSASVSVAPAPAPGSAPIGPEGAPVPDISPAPEPISEAEREAALAGAEDVNEMSNPLPARRLTLAERLSLQNAICALWHNSMKQEPTPVENLDLMDLDAPDHIFISPSAGFYFENGVWIFEGLLRQMAPQQDGIEAVSRVQYFNVQFKPLEDGGFFPVVIHFADTGAG